MKTKFVLMMFAAIVLFSCQKRETEPINATQDVVFTANVVEPGTGLKSTDDWDCKDLEPDYAHIVIDGTDYYPAVFRLDGVLYTQAIKLPVGSYTVELFLLMDDNGTPGVTGDDQIVMGTPAAGSDYAVYVTETVDFDFDVLAFTKIELNVEVLCFLDAEYDAFGFDWFQIDEIVIREICFFGDICLNGTPYLPGDYAGSAYASDGLQEDEAAIFEVRVFKNGNPVPYSPFSNLEWLGVGQPLCVQYPDILNIDEEVFTFELWVLVKNQLGGFSYQLYATYTATDDGEPLDANSQPVTGDANVIDFVVGTCSPMSTNVYDWLPAPPSK